MVMMRMIMPEGGTVDNDELMMMIRLMMMLMWCDMALMMV